MFFILDFSEDGWLTATVPNSIHTNNSTQINQELPIPSPITTSQGWLLIISSVWTVLYKDPSLTRLLSAKGTASRVVGWCFGFLASDRTPLVGNWINRAIEGTNERRIIRDCRIESILASTFEFRGRVIVDTKGSIHKTGIVVGTFIFIATVTAGFVTIEASALT